MVRTGLLVRVGHRSAVTAAVALVAVGLSACASPGAPARTQDGIAPNTARVTVDGGGAVTSDAACTQNGWTTTIQVGDKGKGATAFVQTGSAGVDGKSLRLSNVEGFSGSTWDGNNGEVRASKDGVLWTVSGTVEGFNDNADSLQRESRDVTIEANC